MIVDYQFGIIGAGFGGLIAALELKKSGRDSFLIFERAADVGGTWRDNIYPGCSCDIRSNLYSISGQPNPNWSKAYSGQPEIWQYLKDVTQNNDLQKHIQYNTDIVEMRFMKDAGCWQVTDQNGKTYLFKMMILATGPYNHPHIPVFSGEETFEGKKFHSYHWDTAVDFTGKKVAVIGTGASVIQIVPQLAPIAQQLTVFQRSPAWITFRKNRQTSSVRKWLFRNLPFTQKIVRQLIYLFNEYVGLSLIGNDQLNKYVSSLSLKKLNAEVNDPEIRAKLIPDYKLGCKRILVSDDFYPAFNCRNVELVTESITKITAHEIHTGEKGYKADIIVLATGYITADIYPYIKILWFERAFHGSRLGGERQRGF